MYLQGNLSHTSSYSSHHSQHILPMLLNWRVGVMKIAKTDNNNNNQIKKTVEI